MRKKQQQDYVRPITTGHVEADMLGQCYIWLSERPNRPYSSKYHRQQLKKYSFLSRREVALLIATRGQPSVFRRAFEWFKWPLRKFKALQDKKDAGVPRYLQGVRNKKRNGK